MTTTSLTGVSSTGSVNFLSPNHLNVTLIGVSATAAPHGLTQSNDSQFSLTGVIGVTAANPIFAIPGGNVTTATLTGVTGTAQAFSLTAGPIIALTGVTAQASPGAVNAFVFQSGGFLLGPLIVNMIQTNANDGTVSLTYSDTAGNSWSNPREASIGNIGTYAHNIQFRRLGYARNRIFRLSWSLARPTALVGVFLNTTQGGS